ncbi:hypothetical protein VARIO8X_60052 [Burkholderiales bacterium 8X]|nr:hypothetical protein VARIO8X_60052 [Burkholderiales bacterium 8X]
MGRDAPAGRGAGSQSLSGMAGDLLATIGPRGRGG